MKKLTEKDFWLRVDKRSENECWLWKGPIVDRYGGFGRREYAHRASWRFNRDYVPEGLEVLHTCDNTMCVNPNHLYLGTQKDNMADRKVRGPINHGGPKKFSDEIIQLVLGLYNAGIYSQAELSRRYKISDSHISTLIQRQLSANILKVIGVSCI